MKQLFTAFLFLISTSIFAQTIDSTSIRKIDSLLVIQKQMYREIKNEPTVGKKIGIEINPARILIYPLFPSFTGSLSFFDVHPKAELSFPISYSRNFFGNEDGRTTIVECYYRYFLGNTRNGFYIFPAARFANIEGEVSTSNSSYFTNSRGRTDVINKFGVGFGFGVRVFSYSGFYWGTSLSMGSYLIGKNNHFLKEEVPFISSDSKYWINLELLKFGWAF